MDHKLIPPDAVKLMKEQDEARRKASIGATSERFRRNFINSYADQIMMMQRGAVVKETVADMKRRLNIPVTDWLDEERVFSVEMPNNKPVLSLKQARRAIWWSRVTRPFRNFVRWVNGLFNAT